VEDPELNVLAPSLAREGKALYYSGPAFMEATTRENLSKTVTELSLDGENTILTSGWERGQDGKPKRKLEMTSVDLRFKFDDSAPARTETDVDAPPPKVGAEAPQAAAGGGGGD